MPVVQQEEIAVEAVAVEAPLTPAVVVAVAVPVERLAETLAMISVASCSQMVCCITSFVALRQCETRTNDMQNKICERGALTVSTRLKFVLFSVPFIFTFISVYVVSQCYLTHQKNLETILR